MPSPAPRVVILVENLPVPLDRRVWLEACTLRDAGWEVIVIGPQGGPGMRALAVRTEGISVYRYPQYEATGLLGYIAEYVPSMLFSFVWLLWARSRGRIDVIHGCNPPDLFWIFGVLGRLWGSAYVFDLHDANPELARTKFGFGLQGRILSRLTLALEKASFRTASLVLTVNETCRDIVAERGRVREDQIVILRNSPDVSVHRQFAHGIDPQGLGVGYVGVMGTHDGLDVLVDAWAIVKQQPDLADARLELIGDGQARHSIEDRIQELGLGGSVRLWGFQPPSVYVPILARCLIGVSPDLPTPFNDLAAMVKIVDYMAIGRGCVAFDLTESRRLGGGSLLIANRPDASGLAAALIEVLRNPDRARQLGSAAVARLEEMDLDWDHYGRALVSAYSSLMKRS